jgi:hypothetical protein
MDHITDMRKVLAIVALLASSACGTGPGWQKPGADQSLVDGDLLQCRREAVQETMRLFADWRPFAFDTDVFWNYRSAPARRAVQRSNDFSQLQAEQTLAVGCMRNKGYSIAGA